MAPQSSAARSHSRASPSDGSSNPRGWLVTSLCIVWLLLFSLFFYTRSIGPGEGIPRLTILLQLPELLGSNFTPADNAGWRFLRQRLDLLAPAALVLLAAWGGGRVLLTLVRIEFPPRSVEGAAVTFGVGLSVWSLATLVLGLAGLLSPLWFVALAVVSGARGLWLAFQRRPAESASTSQALTEVRPSRLPLLVLLVSAPFVLSMLLGSLLPTFDFDVKEYHLEGPKEYYLNGRITLLPHNVYTSFPFLTEMLSLSAMVIRGDWLRGAQAGQAILMSYALITAGGLFSLARRLFDKTVAWWAVLLWLTNPWTYRISIIAYTEGALACYLTLSTLAFVHWNESRRTGSPRQQTGWLLLLGLLVGSAAATKYPGVVSAAIPFGLAVVWLAARGPTDNISREGMPACPSAVRRILTTVVPFTAGVLLTFGPWLLKNLAETGNPVYPLLWSIFGGDSFDAATNVRWKAAHAAPTYLWTQPQLILPDLWRQLLDIFLGSQWQMPLLGGLLPLSLLGWKRHPSLRWLWLYVVWLLLTWCWLTHRIDRFWVPTIPLLSLLAAVGLREVHQRLPSGDADTPSWPSLGLRAVLVGVVAIAVLFSLGFNSAALFAGFNGYLLSNDAAREAVLNGSVRLCEQADLPPDAKVLFVGEAAVFEARFPYVYNTVFDDSYFAQIVAEPVADRPESQWPLRDSVEIRRRFQQLGITHVCVNWLEVVRYRLPGSYGFPDAIDPDRFEALMAAGVLQRTSFVASQSWLETDPAYRQSITTWAPALRLQSPAGEFVRVIELYRVEW
ncbi:MAG: ArnT family glycosyltransferase [Planctomycetaceae bacterium]